MSLHFEIVALTPRPPLGAKSVRAGIAGSDSQIKDVHCAIAIDVRDGAIEVSGIVAAIAIGDQRQVKDIDVLVLRHITAHERDGLHSDIAHQRIRPCPHGDQVSVLESHQALA